MRMVSDKYLTFWNIYLVVEDFQSLYVVIWGLWFLECVFGAIFTVCNAMLPGNPECNDPVSSGKG